MDCQKLAALTAWDCSNAGVNSIRAISPITLGEDGTHLSFFIATPSETTFFITDACETAMHAEHLGIELSKSKLDSLNKTCGVRRACFDQDGAIVAEGHIEELQMALWDAVKLAMALSSKNLAWRPKFEQSRFRDIVIAELAAQVGMQRILTARRVKGLSGHVIEFPIGVRRENGNICLVQPIALNNGAIDWPLVWQAHGKLFDIMQIAETKDRLAILEDGAPKDDYGRAVTFLTHAATVRTLTGTKNWQEVFA